jgi:alpha-1,2-mannosyltransferase
MSLIRKLLVLSLLNIAVGAVIFATYPRYSSPGEPRYNVPSAIGDVLHRNILADSAVFIDEAWNVVHAKQPLYENVFFERHIKFIYPTSSLLIDSLAHGIHIPLVPLIRRLVLLSFFLTLVVAGDCFLLVLPEAFPGRGQRWLIRLTVASLGLCFYPLLYSTTLGQIGTFLCLLFTCAVWFWMRGQRAVAGLCVAVICIFKPPLALFLLWAMLRKQWTFFWTFAAALVLIEAVSGLLFGWHNELAYLTELRYLSHHGEILFQNMSVNGMLERLLNNGTIGYWTVTSPYPPYNAFIYAATLLSSAIFVLFALIAPIRLKSQGTTSDFLLFGMLATLASPIVWIHHYSIFFVGCVYLLAAGLKQRGRIPYAFAVCFIVLANVCHIPDRLEVGLWAPLFTYDLYAGLGIILMLAFCIDHAREQRPIPA